MGILKPGSTFGSAQSVIILPDPLGPKSSSTSQSGDSYATVGVPTTQPGAANTPIIIPKVGVQTPNMLIAVGIIAAAVFFASRG